MTPKVSIIYLTKNGGTLLRRSLERVFSQKTGFPFEIIAVDSGSTDGTLETLAEFPVRVKHITADAFNFGLTRNLGFSLAHGEILVSLSQDAVPTTDYWLQSLCAPFEDPGTAAVQGWEVAWPDRDVFFWNRVGVSHLVRAAKRWARLHQGVGLSFVNCAVRRSVWEKNQLGPVEMSEDKVFQKMIDEQGHQIVAAREVKVFHSHQYDRTSLAKRCKNEGLGFKNVGINYSRGDMIQDMFHPIILMFLVYGLVTLQIRTWAELLFPWIRPINLYHGNHFTEKFIH